MNKFKAIWIKVVKFSKTGMMMYWRSFFRVMRVFRKMGIISMNVIWILRNINVDIKI